MILELMKNSSFLDFIQLLVDKELEAKPQKTKIIYDDQINGITNPLI